MIPFESRRGYRRCRRRPRCADHHQFVRIGKQLPVILMPVRRTTAWASFISGPTISGFGSLAESKCALPFSRTWTASASIGCGRRTIFFFVMTHPLSQITAAADIQGNAGDVTRFIGSKEHDSRSDFLHRAEASQGNLAEDSLFSVFFFSSHRLFILSPVIVMVGAMAFTRIPLGPKS